MKRFITYGILILFMLISLVGCGHKEAMELMDVPETKEPQIVWVNENVNYAWGYQHEGTFMDSEGNVYAFSFSVPNFYPDMNASEDTIVDKLQAICPYVTPLFTLDEDVVKKIYNLGQNIDVTETYETENMSFDRGEKILSFYNSKEGKRVKCREVGDNTGELDSKAAKKFMEYFDETVMTKIQTACTAMDEQVYEAAVIHYYDASLFLKNIHSGYMTDNGFMTFVVENDEDIKDLEKQTGSDFGISKWKEEHAGDYVFFLAYDAVSSTGYDIKKKGLLYQNNKVMFVPDIENSVSPGPGDIVGEAMDGFIFIGAIPVEVLQDGYTFY